MNLPATTSLAWNDVGRAQTHDGYKAMVYRGLLTQRVIGRVSVPNPREIPLMLMGQEIEAVRLACESAIAEHRRRATEPEATQSSDDQPHPRAANEP